VDVDALWPRTPPSPPAGLGAVTPAYRRHLAAALAALFAFVGLYLALLGWLARTWWALWPKGALAFWVGGAPLLLLLAFLASGLFAIRRRSYGPAARELTAADEPVLFAFLHRVADEAGAPRPHRVFLVPDVTAAVAYDVAIWNLVVPTRKNLLLGLGLVNALTLDELKAVLAHEFGHFSQRSTQIGSYTYVAMQVVAHLVGHRGGIDTFLGWLSVQDVRVAWIGWALRLVIWSIRSVLDSAFRLLLRLERALSREMEFQADLVAVRLSGSDSLVHALSRLVAADEAWTVAIGVAEEGAREKQRADDLYALQTAALHHLRRVRADPAWGEPPPVPADGAGHRVFTPDTVVVPQMWASHPSNPDRERNAKAAYVPSALDRRPAWALFRDPEATRREMTERLVALATTEGELADLRPRLVDRFDVAWAHPRFHGVWLGRSVVRAVADPRALVGPIEPDLAAGRVLAELDALYPASLGPVVRSAREHDAELTQLRALRDGLVEAPGGVVRFRGRELGSAALAEAFAEVEADRDRANSALVAHDRAARTAHRRAARLLGHGWEEWHDGLLRLLHLVEHSRSDLDDARGVLVHVVAVVTADGSVTRSEGLRVLKAAREAEVVLRHLRGLDVTVLPPLVEAPARLGAHLPDAAALPPPDDGNLGPWLQVFDAWSQAVVSALGALRARVLTQLLSAEDRIAAMLRAQVEIPDQPVPAAPPPPLLPARWPTLVPGAERPRTDRLTAWDRFLLADGPWAGAARFGAAAGVLGAVFAGTRLVVVDPALVVWNGLDVPVTVDLGTGVTARLGPGERTRVDPGGTQLQLTVTGADGSPVASFPGAIDRSGEWMLGVGCWWLEATALYGRGAEPPPPRAVGGEPLLPQRWDFLDGEVPDEVDTGRRPYAFRSVVRCEGAPPPPALAAQVPPSVAATHLRVDTPERALDWFRAAPSAESWAALTARPDAGAHRLRFAVAALAQGRREPCDAPGDDGIGALVAAACAPPGPDRDARVLAAAGALPNEPWARLEAADALARGERWSEAAAQVAGLPPSPSWDTRRLRIARRAGVPVSTDLGPLQALVDADAAGSRLDGPLGHLAALAAGDLSPTPPTGYLREDHRVLRGASLGAPPDAVAGALERTEDAEVLEVLVIGAALHLRERGRVPEPLLHALRARPSWAVVAPVLGPAVSGTDEALDAFARGLAPGARGLVFAFGAVLRGDAAPEAWRAEARALLLPWERPWLGRP
jgi:Zn-dependent protease with chaperone function